LSFTGRRKPHNVLNRIPIAVHIQHSAKGRKATEVGSPSEWCDPFHDSDDIKTTSYQDEI
jgi:hypothetical protein